MRDAFKAQGWLSVPVQNTKLTQAKRKNPFCDHPWTEALLAGLQSSIPATYLTQAPGSTQTLNGFSHELTGVLVHPAAKGIF